MGVEYEEEDKGREERATAVLVKYLLVQQLSCRHRSFRAFGRPALWLQNTNFGARRRIRTILDDSSLNPLLRSCAPRGMAEDQRTSAERRLVGGMRGTKSKQLATLGSAYPSRRTCATNRCATAPDSMPLAVATAVDDRLPSQLNSKLVRAHSAGLFDQVYPVQA